MLLFLYSHLVPSERLSVLGLPQDDVISPDATEVKWDFAQWCQVGTQRFTLEKSTLGEVLKALGSGAMTRDGHEGDTNFEWLVRYRWGGQVIVFSSNNEMGGDTHSLQGVDLRPASEVWDAFWLPRLHGPISFPFGEPGMSFQALTRELGPAKLDRDKAEYRYRDTEDLHARDADGSFLSLDLTGWLRVKVADGKVTRMTLSHVTEEWAGAR